MDVPKHHRVRFAADEPPMDAAARLRSACELADAARELKRAQLRSASPDASEADIDTMVEAWLRTRPGAELGDGVGRPGRWPRG